MYREPGTCPTGTEIATSYTTVKTSLLIHFLADAIHGAPPGLDESYQTALFRKDHCWGGERVARDFEFTSHSGPLAHVMEGAPKLTDGRPALDGASELNRWPSALPKGAPLPLRAQREVRTATGDVDRESAEVQCVYYRMISKVDALVGRIVNAIESEGLWDDTVVLFWSDHGDYAGQYGLAEKWDTSFADCLVKVPCLLVAPGIGPRRVEALTETTDLAPTLARLLDLPPLVRAHGEDLAPVIAGGPGKEAVFADGGHEREMRERFAHEHPVGGATSRAPAGLSRSAKSETYSR